MAPGCANKNFEIKAEGAEGGGRGAIISYLMIYYELEHNMQGTYTILYVLAGKVNFNIRLNIQILALFVLFQIIGNLIKMKSL